MTVRRKDFKYALRTCRNEKEMHKAGALANALQDHSSKKFWQNIRNKKSMLPSMVEVQQGIEAVAEMTKKI